MGFPGFTQKPLKAISAAECRELTYTMSHIERFAGVASAVGYPVSLERAKILDFGCGSGAAVAEERANGLDVFGCDISLGLTSAPKDLVQRGVLRAIEISNYRIPFENAEFDMLFSHLEHVMNYEEVLREMRRVLKSGGISIHLFPSRYTRWSPMFMCLSRHSFDQ